MVRARRRTSVVAGGAAALLCLATVSGVLGATAAGASSSSRVLAGTAVNSLAREHPVGGVAKSAPINFQLVLKLRDAAGAAALVRAVSSPGSASFRHYLNAAQWEARFSPSVGEVNAARAWLASQGFTVGAVSKDRVTVAASGTAGQVEKAFGTGLENYRFAGQTVRLATTDLSVPASLAGSVVGAMGINQNFATAAVASQVPRSVRAGTSGEFPPAPGAFVPGKPCAAYYGSLNKTVIPPFGHGYPSSVPYAVCGYKPGQFRSAYKVGSATGAGVTVAIVDAYGSATIASDATRYFATEDPGNPFSNADLTQQLAIPFDNESECDSPSWLVEQAIDVEAVHSMARDAHILYVGAQDCLDPSLYNADAYVIDNGLASVVTNSWADPGGDVFDDVATKTAFDDLFMLADTTGITVQFSTGDDGDNFNLLGISAPSYPSDSPFVTGVGGTTLQIGASGQAIAQLGWFTGRSFKCTANVAPDLDCTVGTWLPVTEDGGSGGYTSYYYTQPWYQAPVVPAGLSTRNSAVIGPTPARVIPDISLDADPATGLLLGLHQTFPNGKAKYSLTRYGGTSLASPLLAGVIADVDQTAGVSVGFINPAIYRLQSTAGAIYDVVPGGKQAQYRVDHADTYLPGVPGNIFSFREITYEGPEVYCDGTGNCASRPNTLSTAPGYDSMTGLGSIGPDFISDLASP